VPDAPLADGKIHRTDQGTDARQNRDTPPHRFLPDHF
jgi:hypothetical protein